MIKPAAVAGGGGVVELIPDHHLEALGGDLREGAVGQRLHGGERMAPLVGHLAIHIQLPKGGIAQHLAEGGQGLQQGLLAVGDQQQRRWLGRGELLGEVGMETGHVEGGEHGLAGAGHHEVAPALVERALGGDGIEHLALVGEGPQGEPHRRGGDARATRGGRIHTPGQGELVIEAIALLGGGGIGLEFALLPVGLKGAFKLAQQRGRFQGRQALVPIQPVERGRSREVGGADVGGGSREGGREARPMEQPDLDEHRARLETWLTRSAAP